MVRVAGRSGFHDHIGIAAQIGVDQAFLHRAHKQRRRNRLHFFADGFIRQHQQHRTIAHGGFHFVAQALDGIFQAGFGGVIHCVEHHMFVMLLRQAQQLLHIGIKQHRRFEVHAVAHALGFEKHAHFAADAGGQAHHMRFTQRVDRRIGDLCKILAEIIVNQARPLAEHGKRRIIAHRAHRLLAVFTHHAHHAFNLFAVIQKLLLIHGQRFGIHRRFAHFVFRQLLKRNQPLHVFIQPNAVRVAGAQLLVDLIGMQQLTFFGVDYQQLAGADAAFFHHFVRRVIPNAHFRSNGD